MDYEKLHKETLQGLQRLVSKGEITEKAAKEICPDFIAESEDEKFLRYLIGCCKDTIESDDKGLELSMVTTKRLFAWLEKQGEKGINGKNREIPFSEQKPAWSEEDEEALRLCLRAIETAFYYKMDYKFQATDWLKSLKDRVQPEQEWSEEDENTLNSIINYLEEVSGRIALPNLKENYIRQIDWLKSLRPQKVQKVSKEDLEKMGKQIAEYNKLLEQLRPQNAWKPSEEEVNKIISIDQQICDEWGILKYTNEHKKVIQEIIKRFIKS